MGRLIATLADPLGGTEGLWALLQQVVDARSPANATGQSLDDICALNGIIRQPATKASGKIRCYANTEGVQITMGSVVRKSTTGDLFQTTYTADTIQTYTSPLDNGATAGTNTAEVADNSGFAVGDWVTIENSTPREELMQVSAVDGDGITLTFSTYFQYDHAMTTPCTLYSVDIDAEAQTEGALSISDYQINEIVTPISGWEYVLNVPANPTWNQGTDVESDVDLRARRLRSFQVVGAGTDGGIRARLEQLSFVESCNVVSNRTMITDVTSKQPAKSLWPIVYPTALTDAQKKAILAQLWLVCPAGIQVWGGKQSVIFTIGDVVTNAYYNVTINGVDYSYQASGFESKSTIAIALAGVISDVSVTASHSGTDAFFTVVANNGYGYFSYDCTATITMTDDEAHVYGLVEDDMGYEQLVGFSTATPKVMYVKVAIRTDSSYPTDGETQIQDALLAVVAAKKLGEDVTSREMVDAVAQITGVTDIQLQLNWTGFFGSYPADSYTLSVSDYEYPTLVVGNITIASF